MESMNKDMDKFSVLFLGGLVSVAQVTTVRKIQAHESPMRGHQGLVDLQIGRAAAKALHVDSPLIGIQAESLQGSLLTGNLNGIDVLVAAIVPGTGITLRVLVAHGRTQGIEHGTRSNILRGNQEDRFALALDFFFLQGESVRVCDGYHSTRAIDDIMSYLLRTMISAISGSLLTSEFSICYSHHCQYCTAVSTRGNLTSR